MGKKSASGDRPTPKDVPSAAPASTGGAEIVTPSSAPPGLEHSHPHIEFKFFAELKHRNVVRVALLYLVVCWLILEPIHVVFHMLEVPVWANRLVLILMAVGLPAVVVFAWAFEVTPDGLKPTVEVDPNKSIRSLTGRRLDRAIIVVLVLALGYFVVDKFWLAGREAVAEGNAVAPAAPAPSARGEVGVPEKSIAVLPFVDMSERHDQEYFSDGLSEELIDQLAKVPQLRVIARTSSFSFRNRADDIPTIARKLNVANILEGSVRRSGVRLRVTTQLIQADSGRDIWSQTYDQELKDVFKVQDEIAGAVVAALKVHLLPSQKLSGSQRTQNTEAYNQYLLGRQFFDRFTLNDWRRAIKSFRKAIELDPNFPAAYAGLSAAEFWEANQTGDNAGFERAMASAEKAVALAPEQAEGYAARGYLRNVVSWDWAGAQADLQKALTFDPGNAQILGRFAILSSTLGQLPDAIAAGKKATELDPLRGAGWWALGLILMDAQQFEAAHDAIARALEISPDNGRFHYALGFLELFEGKATEAAATFRQVETEGAHLTGTSMAEYSLGHARESQQALDELIARDAQAFAYQIAEVYAWRREKDKAFEWLDRAYRQHDAGLVFVKHDLALASLRSDSRFAAFLRKMKLPE